MTRDPVLALDPVDDQTPLWRYMSATKLFSMFSTRTLYLSRADAFDDPFDGALGPEPLRDKVLSFITEPETQIVESVAHPADAKVWDESSIEKFQFPIPDDLWNLMLRKLGSAEAVRNWIASDLNSRFRDGMSETHRQDMNLTFISCWHASVHESEAMWKLYSKDTSEGVAVRTGPRRLIASINSMQSCTDAALYPVRYDNNYVYQEGDHKFARFTHKRKAFEHEREVRLIVQNPSAAQENKKGIQIDFDLDTAIEEIVVSPFAQPWSAQVIVDVAKKFEIKAPITASQLDRKAFRY